ncbi:MAG TPA: YfiR family protein [Steroidobacteraceae bacterium]|nr:YfiR family protein [Steroidobacteraceae bacterium]
MRVRRYAVRAALLVCALTIMQPLQAAVFSADAVKAAFLYRFASYVEWPEDAPDGPLVIAVSGADQVAEQLGELLPKVNVDGRPVEVRRVSKPAELDGVHILYVGPDSLARTRALRTAALDRPILIVTDDAKGLDSGGVINFVEAEHNVRFEISLLAADRARLKINSALLSVAARVERRPQAWTSCADPYVRRYRPSSCLIRTASVAGGALR